MISFPLLFISDPWPDCRWVDIKTKLFKWPLLKMAVRRWHHKSALFWDPCKRTVKKRVREGRCCAENSDHSEVTSVCWWLQQERPFCPRRVPITRWHSPTCSFFTLGQQRVIGALDSDPRTWLSDTNPFIRGVVDQTV